MLWICSYNLGLAQSGSASYHTVIALQDNVHVVAASNTARNALLPAL
jgi:hypothetical protein